MRVQVCNSDLIIEKEFELEKDIFEMFGKMMDLAQP